MKIRTGLVSNSSSSSYVIYGVEMDIDQAKTAVLTTKLCEVLLKQRSALGVEYQYMPLEEILEEVPIEALGEVGFIVDYDHEQAYWGYHPFFGMEEDETKAQFRARTQNKVTEFFGPEMECELHQFQIYG